MKRTTYALIIYVALMAVCVIAFFIALRSTRHESNGYFEYSSGNIEIVTAEAEDAGDTDYSISINISSGQQ